MKNSIDLNKLIYKILKQIKICNEQGIDLNENIFSYESFGTNIKTFYRTLDMLQRKGYIEGLTNVSTLNDVDYSIDNIIITTDGLTFLEENNVMKKIAKEALKTTIGIIKKV